VTTPQDPTQPYGQQPDYGQPTYGQPTYGQPGYGQPGYVDPLYGGPVHPAFPPVMPKHPSATTAMVLGVVGVGSLALGGFGLVCSPFAWAIGAKAVREIDADPTRWSGRSEANTGKITGIIGTALLVLGILAVVAFIVLVMSIDAPSTSTDVTFDSNV
jgi:hypothetical protein